MRIDGLFGVHPNKVLKAVNACVTGVR